MNIDHDDLTIDDLGAASEETRGHTGIVAELGGRDQASSGISDQD